MLWVTIAPIHYPWDLPHGVTLPYRFAERVHLDEVPSWVKTDDVLKYLSHSLRTELEDRARYCISVSYDADAFGTPDPDWKGDVPRSIQDSAYEQIQHVGFSMWLARPSAFTFSCVFHGHQVQGESLMRHVFQTSPICPLPEYESAELKIEDFVAAGDLARALRTLGVQGTLRAATQAATRAITETGWTLRFLILWLVIESLFGPEDAREITFRLSQRLALFMGIDSEETRALFRKAKASYDWRSKIVHGLRLAKSNPEKSRELLLDLESLVRQSLRKILGDQVLTEQFDGKDREEFLDDLVFAR